MSAPAIPIEEAGARLTIDLAALADNYRTLRARSGAAACAAVVKADAYGLGLAPAGKALHEAGARTFFVAHPFEARELLAACPGIACYVLNGMPPGAAPLLATLGARPVLCTPDDVAEWAAFCRAQGRRLPAALQIDTGMNRLGLSMDDARAVAGDGATTDAFELALVMSHFVSSEEPGNPLNDRQIEAFRAARALFPDTPASLANSSGIFLDSRPLFDLVRPGYALYGGNPEPGRDNAMRPVVTLEARVVQIRDIAAGETVGYNAQWTADTARRLAICSIGYADGFPRPASHLDTRTGGHAIAAGRRCAIVGRVSMDLIVIDVTDCDPAPARGEFVQFLGPDIGIDELAQAAGTIGYDLLTRLGQRFARVYRHGETG